MKISSPWVRFYRELEALFAQDEEVRVAYDEEKNVVSLYVDNGRKADALAKLLPSEKTFGNVTLKIEVVPANAANSEDKTVLLQEAFYGNPALRYVLPVDCPIGHFDYAIFENKVVQFFNDNLADPNGLCSTLYEDIARDVFEDAGMYFCTETRDAKLGKPLGEWP